MADKTILTDEYEKLCELNLAKDKKAFWEINLLSASLCVVMFLFGNAYSPVYSLFEEVGAVLRLIVLAVGCIAYFVLHELVHGIFMKYFSGEPVKYGAKSLYFYAGSDAYFRKSPYIIIALAPVTVLGVVLVILNVIVDTHWFWVVFFIQLINISGSSGDIYVVLKFLNLPNDVLIHDSGVAMEVYGKR